ncbi:MAG: GtrA family protein [Clostridiales bacterium]|jgi:putative flippase GtrA|nr:GtrA family protein [Clostridiales bacterium]
MTKKNKAELWALAIQFIKFGIVGLSNTAVNFAVYYVLLLLGVYYVIATILAFAVSVINAFFWSSKFVFKSKEKNLPKKLAKVYISYGITFLLSMGTLILMVDVLQISEYIAPLINLCITVPLNFLLNRFWAFL